MHHALIHNVVCEHHTCLFLAWKRGWHWQSAHVLYCPSEIAFFLTSCVFGSCFGMLAVNAVLDFLERSSLDHSSICIALLLQMNAQHHYPPLPIRWWWGHSTPRRWGTAVHRSRPPQTVCPPGDTTPLRLVVSWWERCWSTGLSLGHSCQHKNDITMTRHCVKCSNIQRSKAFFIRIPKCLYMYTFPP